MPIMCQTLFWIHQHCIKKTWVWLHQSYASLLCSKTNGFIPSSCWKTAQVILSNGGIWNICIKFRGDWYQGININFQVRDLNIKVINFWVAIQLQTISHIGFSLIMTQPAFVLLTKFSWKEKSKCSYIIREGVVDDQLYHFLGPALRLYSCPGL